MGRYKSSSTSQKSIANIQGTNQLVPYGKGHQSGQKGDVSMALAYTFDSGGKLKRFDFTGNGAVMNFLHQIGRRSSMQQSSTSNMQWQSQTQFPTLTNLHIDEIAKGAQKLNQILTACSSGINIDNGSIEVGKELWKGAKELEQSLRMLVNLQEASECMASPQRKSRLKLLEESDSEDESTIGKEKQKQVERPVFSFDRASKNIKGTVQPGLQQKLMALTYLREDPNPKPERQASMTPKSVSHKRSTSCGPSFQTSKQTNSLTAKHDDPGGIPNVIAKLMGLGELPQNVNPNVATESRTISKRRSGEEVLTGTGYRSSKSAEFITGSEKDAKVQRNNKGVHSSKIASMKSHKPDLPEEAHKLTQNYSYRNRADLQKPRMSEVEREEMRNPVRESQEAIIKINELKSQITQPNQNGESQKQVKKETRVNSTQSKRQDVKSETEDLQRMSAERSRCSEAVDKVHTETLGDWNTPEREKKAKNKPLIHQHRHKGDDRLQQPQVPPGTEPQGKKLNSKERTQDTEINKSEPRKTEGNAKRLKKSQNLVADVKNTQKQQPTKQPYTAKKNTTEGNGLTASKAPSSCRENKDLASEHNSVNSNTNQTSSASLRAEQNAFLTDRVSQTTQVCVTSNVNAKLGYVSAKNVVGDTKPLKTGSTRKTTEVMTKSLKTVTRTAKTLKPQRSILQGLKQKQLDKISNSEAAAQTSNSMSKPINDIPVHAEPSTPPMYEESQQQINTAQMANTDNPTREESQCQEEVVALPPNSRSESTAAAVSDEQGQHTAPAQSYKDNRDVPYNIQLEQQRHTKMEKQEPLTDEEMYLKQKLIISHLFLNTAEALFKLNIPIGILNYASDQICQEKDNKLILDCGYEVLKRKGRRQDIRSYPRNNKYMSCKKIRSLDDLVRQLHKDFENLRSYGKNGKEDCDDADYILKMLERDIHYRDPDVNSMWDLGWNENMFAYLEIDEVIRDVERDVLHELVEEIAKG